MLQCSVNPKRPRSYLQGPTMRSFPLTVARTRAIRQTIRILVVRTIASALALRVAVVSDTCCAAVCDRDRIVDWWAIDALIAVNIEGVTYSPLTWYIVLQLTLGRNNHICLDHCSTDLRTRNCGHNSPGRNYKCLDYCTLHAFCT